MSLAAALALALAACDSGERVEYRMRPKVGVDMDGPSEFIAPDGTRVVFVDHPANAGRKPNPAAVEGNTITPRKQLDDGTVVLRNVMPQHVVGNAMECFRNEEWRIMWDQLLAPDARAAYEAPGGGGFEAFEGWCVKNRKGAMELLNRMRFDAMGSDVGMRRIGPGLTRATLAPHLWDQFGLRVVEFEQTPDGMRLRSIRANP